MFVVIEYIRGTFENINLMVEEDKPILFGSYHSAEQYAKANCSWNYKIVELD